MVSLRTVRSAVVMATACVILASGGSAGAAERAKSAPPAQGGASSAAGGAAGGAVERIAAVVNEDAISQSDVVARARLSLLNAGMPDTPDARQRVLPQVLRQLVDERLQLQEAKRLGISIPSQEIDQAIGRIAEGVRLSRPQLNKLLAEHNVPVSTLNEQVRATLAWQKVLQRRIRQEIMIGDEEIDAQLERFKAAIGKPEYLVAEIFLSVDSPDQDDQARRTAERLMEEIKRGANFAAVARQFSQSAAAANNGDLGWVRPGEMGGEIDSTLASSRPGQMVGPVRTAGGYHVLLVRARRAVGSAGSEELPQAPRPAVQRPVQKIDVAKAKVHMKQIVLPSPSPEALKATHAAAEKLQKTIKGCGDFEEKAKATGVPESGDMGTVSVKDLPPQLGQLVLQIPIGRPSPVLKGQGGALILIVCKRDAPLLPLTPEEKAQLEAANAPPPPPPPVKGEPAKLPSREDIEQELVAERAELLSRRYLRDLRRSAFVEYRV